MSKKALFTQMGGRESLIKINQIFYDKVYQHPWLKLYFQAVPQAHIENQQVDFMEKVLGGENRFAGKSPPAAHKHIFITEELFELRQQLLKEAFVEANASLELVDKWLMLDESFKRIIVKSAVGECQPRYNSDPILDFPKP